MIILHTVLHSATYYIDVSSHPNSLTWKAYKLEKAESTQSAADSDPNVFCKRFQLYFNDTCDYVSVCILSCQPHNILYSNYNIMQNRGIASFSNSTQAITSVLAYVSQQLFYLHV